MAPKSKPQDAAAKKDAGVKKVDRKKLKLKMKRLAVDKMRGIARKKVHLRSVDPMPSLKQIGVIKRQPGTIKFARAIKTFNRDLKKKNISSHCKKCPKGKTPEKKKKGSDKLRVCRMRKVYETQLPMRYAKPKGYTKSKHTIAKLRKSLVPGTVCIILNGRHKGKKCIFLKQLRRSGLLLVTGPHKVTGIAMRRIDQKHVIATSVRCDLGTYKVPERIDDFWFKVPRGTRSHRRWKAHPNVLKEEVFDKKGRRIIHPKGNLKKFKLPLDRKKAQAEVDTVVVKALKAHKERNMVIGYMKRQFGLRGDRYIHKMKF